MAYSDFTIQKLKKDFGLQVDEQRNLFVSVEPVAGSELLNNTLQETVQLAIAINTEKARSEMIIIPVLLEVRRQGNGQVSLFSGTEFNVDDTRMRNRSLLPKLLEKNCQTQGMCSNDNTGFVCSRRYSHMIDPMGRNVAMRTIALENKTIHTFTAILYREEDVYVAECPEVGTASQGETIEEALANLQEATELYLEEFPVPHITRRLITTFEVACAQATES